MTAEALSRAAPGQHVELAISGMTCASCAARIEKKLNRLDGVTATVNYATETATVDFEPGTVVPDELVSVVESIGYGAALPAPPAADEPATEEVHEDDTHVRVLRQRLLGSARADRAGRASRHGPGAAVRQLAVALAHAGRARRHLGGLAVPPGRLAQPAPPRRDDGHAGVGRCPRRVRVVAVGAVPRRRGDGGHADALHAGARLGCRHRRDLPRGRRRRHRVHPVRPLLRGARQASVRCRPARAARAGREGRRGAARRGRDTGAGGAARRRRPLRRTTRREGRDGRGGRGRHVGHRCQPGDRRVRAGRGRAGRCRHGRDRQRRRPARRPSHPGRQRHPPGPDRPAGHRRAVRQGAGAATRRPRGGGLRPGRDRARRS